MPFLSIKVKSNVHGFVHRNSILIYIQQDATSHSLCYLEIAQFSDKINCVTLHLVGYILE
jgi:hypothetical protein